MINSQKEEQLQQQFQDKAKIQQQIDYMESIVKQFLTKDALMRYGNLKIAHQEKALQILLILFQSIQTNQLKTKIDDTKLKNILEQMTPKERKIQIKRV